MKPQSTHLIATLLMFVAPAAVLAQGTAFTYEGRLQDGGQPANGSYDLRFAIYDAGSGGNLLAGPATNSATPVANGLFTVTLDFGGGLFTGPARWLEVGARTNSGGAFVILSPRQELTPTPYAIMANSASNLLGTLPAGQLSGTLASSQVAGTYSGEMTLNNPLNRICGDGSCLTGVNASSLGGVPAANYWQTTGNAGTSAGVNFLGTTDYQPLRLCSGQRGLQLQYTSRGIFPGTGVTFNGAQQSVNVLGGYWGNAMPSSVIGGTIAGGGLETYYSIYFPPGPPVWAPSPNTVNANFGSIGGGYGNTAGYAAAVPGGYNNVATGYAAAVPGGYNNVAMGAGSFAAGRDAQTTYDGSFVWSDGSQNFSGSGTNRFEALASGGLFFYTGGTVPALSITPGNMVAAGGPLSWGANLLNIDQGGSIELGDSRAIGTTPYIDFHYGVGSPQDFNVRLWNDADGQLTCYGTFRATVLVVTSDRNAKENFQAVDPSDVLSKLSSLPITSWNFKTDPSTRHIGPMAQDFYAAFGLGTDDKHIATVDEEGVALAAIRGLNQRLDEKEAEIRELNRRLSALQEQVSRFENWRPK